MQQARRQNRFDELFAQVAELEAREAASNHSESFKRLAMPGSRAAQRGSAHDCGGTGAAMFCSTPAEESMSLDRKMRRGCKASFVAGRRSGPC